ncbi:MAG: hypothetical protein JWR80_6178 [Bradyrhizobium sp.]|nr:hypothetical protein [Bradyrhizobium sp.]
MADDQTQSEKFKQAARDLDCDESAERDAQEGGPAKAAGSGASGRD